jgi:hypothetical protein
VIPETRFGEQLKLDGIARAVEAPTVATWVDEAREVIDQYAALRVEFTSEDVTAIVGLPREGEGMNRNNAVGAVMSGAARAGTIRRVGYRKATRPNQHAAILAVWVGQ